MIEILLAKFLITGAVKAILVKPAITATLSIIPKANFIHTTLLGKDIFINSRHIIKFGMERLYERFGERKLNFRIDKLHNDLYRIVPQNELAKIFFKDYTDEDELLIDLDKMDDYLDLLIKLGEEKIDEEADKIFKSDEVVMQMIYDLDLTVDRSKPGTFGNAKSDKMLVDEIIKKNQEFIEENAKRRKDEIKRRSKPKSVIDQVLSDFPNTPNQPITDTQLIDGILNKIQAEISPRKSKKKLVRS